MFSKIQDLTDVHNDVGEILKELAEMEDGVGADYNQLIEDYKWLKVELHHRLTTLRNEKLKVVEL